MDKALENIEKGYVYLIMQTHSSVAINEPIAVSTTEIEAIKLLHYFKCIMKCKYEPDTHFSIRQIDIFHYAEEYGLRVHNIQEMEDTIKQKEKDIERCKYEIEKLKSKKQVSLAPY